MCFVVVIVIIALCICRYAWVTWRLHIHTTENLSSRPRLASPATWFGTQCGQSQLICYPLLLHRYNYSFPTRLTARRPRRTSLLYDKTLVKNKQTYKNTVHVTMFSADICGIIIIYVWWFVLGYDLCFITGATVIIYATPRHINCPVYESVDIFWSVGNGSMLSMASLT